MLGSIVAIVVIAISENKCICIIMIDICMRMDMGVQVGAFLCTLSLSLQAFRVALLTLFHVSLSLWPLWNIDVHCVIIDLPRDVMHSRMWMPMKMTLPCSWCQAWGECESMDASMIQVWTKPDLLVNLHWANKGTHVWRGFSKCCKWASRMWWIVALECAKP
jgi:hypothetical protein